MSFPTLAFSGPASGGSGNLSTQGTFTATITGSGDGSLSGTWSYSGHYLDSSALGTSGNESVSGTLSGTGSTEGPWTITLAGDPSVTSGALVLAYANGQYTFGVSMSFEIDYLVNLGYDGLYEYQDNFGLSAQLAAAGAPPVAAITDGPDTISGTAGADTIAALGGNDTVSAGDGNDTITGGAGDDSIDGGNGIDTAVFSGNRASYTITPGPGAGTWTVTDNSLTGGDGTDTLVNVERLQFADQSVALDLTGNAGETYRLYQAAFDRVPDLGGLGFQIHVLDSGETLEQLAAQFIASAEFQSTYGNVDNTAFVTLLYQNVLHRDPDAGGLAFHLSELTDGVSRAHVLAEFSESPENQANVLGAIQNGIAFLNPTDGPDSLAGTAGADNIVAQGGNDTITGGGGNDTIDGGSGLDTAVFSDARANYTIAESNSASDTWTVTHNVPGGETSTLINVERLQFEDGNVALDLSGDAGEAYRLYQAAFNRVPDLGGLGFQIHSLDSGQTLDQVAAQFIASNEFQTTFGNLDNTAFVTLLYHNVLNRDPDAGGLAFHVGELTDGVSRAHVLAEFSESPENQANVIGAIENGIAYDP